MQPKKTIGTTLDDLANMVAGGFEHVDKRFEEVDKRFEEVDKRFDAIDKRLDEHDKRFDVVEQKLSKIDYQVDAIHDAVVQLEEGDILDLQKRVGALEKSAKTHVKQLG